jgi:hypothetical protein
MHNGGVSQLFVQLGTGDRVGGRVLGVDAIGSDAMDGFGPDPLLIDPVVEQVAGRRSVSAC